MSVSPKYPLATSSWDQAEYDALQRVIDSDMFSMGPEVRAFEEHFLAGYAQQPAEILSQTLPTACHDLVMLSDIPLSTLCPHHLMPAFGRAKVGYLPSGQAVGFGVVFTGFGLFHGLRVVAQWQIIQRWRAG